MKARGRFLCALIALGIAVCSLPGLWIGVSAQSTALYAQSSRYSKQNQGREYVVSYTFDKAVGAAGEDLSAQADKLIVNGTALSGVDGVSISVSAEDTRSIEAVFPAEAEAGGEPLLEEGEGTDNLITLLGGFGGSFLIYYGFFKSISWNYAEAVMIDGGGPFTIFFKIMLPQTVPMMATFFITGSINVWNDYSTVMLYLPSYPTLASGLFEFKSLATHLIDYPVYFAGLIISMIPTIILFATCSGRIMGTVSIGGLKG